MMPTISSMQCGKASVGDCLQHLENLQHEAFIHKKMINPDQSDDDDDDEEEKVDISMVREAFRILTEGKTASAFPFHCNIH